MLSIRGVVGGVVDGDFRVTRTERLALSVGYAGHGWEHRGKMVVYQRINGIVPPPSV